MNRSSRREVLKGIGAGTTVLLGGVGAASARGKGRGAGGNGRGNGPGRSGRRKGASADASIVEKADELGFSTLIAAVEAADPAVLNTLANDDQYTVFAPTNEAFSDFFATVEDATGIDKSTLLTDPNGLLTKTLLFHVTEGRRYAASVVNPSEVETLLGEAVSVDGTTLDGRATIQTTNVEASNGVIHAIDAVLTPSAVDDLL
jgi:uncharacterized surface protein with fasciclin (FAS1) repeats